MKVTHLTDSALLSETHRLCALERATTLQILHLLKEIEARALFARTHSSLFDFCVKELGFSEDQAQRRISAMRLLKSVPEVEPKVASGELKISQLAQVQTFIRAEKKSAGRVVSKEETHSLLTQLAGRSARETEKVLLEKSPALQTKRQTEEKVRPVTDHLTEVKLVADEELMSLIEEAKGLIAHNGNMNPSLQDVFKRVLKEWIAAKKKQKGITAQTEIVRLPATSKVNEAQPTAKASPPSVPATSKVEAPQTRYIEAPLKRQAFMRSQGQCEFRAKDGKRCTSKHALELHHRLPFARGGTHSLENLAVYCRAHNQAQGVWDFGARSVRSRLRMGPAG